MPDTIKLFGETLSTTKKGRIRAPTAAALLRRRSDLTCRVTSQFDGMSDGHVVVNSVVPATWVVDTMLTKPSGTLSTYRSTRLGADVLCVSNACHNVEVCDAELARRRTMLKTLPLSAHASIDTGLAHRLSSRALPASSFSIIAARDRSLDACHDGIVFDDAIECMRALTTWQELAAYLSQQGHLLSLSCARAT